MSYLDHVLSRPAPILVHPLVRLVSVYTDGPTCDFIVDGLKDEAVASEVQDSALWRLMGLRISATLDELFTMFKCFSSMWDPAKTREPLMHKRYHLLVRVRELMRARLSGEAAR
eukprot:Hpha_TRINITY_DN14067_c0_g2::TRINITY_DN14067_c0_g2_i3::g.43858::m.43858